MQATRISFFPICLAFVATSLLFTIMAGSQGEDPGAQSSEGFLFLTGRVVKPDGTSPSNQEIQVELACGGRVQQQVFTSDQGTFAFKLERMQQQGWMDASVGHDGNLNQNSHWNNSIDKSGVFAASRFKTFNLSGCRIRLSAGQGYTASEISLSNRSMFDSPDVGYLVLGAEGQHTGPVVSVTTLAAPAKAREAYQKAEQELTRRKPNYPRAARELKKAVRLYDGYAEAWYQLGTIQSLERNTEEAADSFQKALVSDPKFVKPYLSLARMALFDEDWQKAADLAEEALTLSPSTAQAHYFKGLSNFSLGKLEEAEAGFHYLKANGYQERYPITLFHLGIIYAQAGRIQEAGENFDQYVRVMPQDQFPPGQKEKIQQQLRVWQEQSLWKRKPDSPEPK